MCFRLSLSLKMLYLASSKLQTQYHGFYVKLLRIFFTILFSNKKRHNYALLSLKSQMILTY